MQAYGKRLIKKFNRMSKYQSDARIFKITSDIDLDLTSKVSKCYNNYCKNLRLLVSMLWYCTAICCRDILHMQYLYNIDM